MAKGPNIELAKQKLTTIAEELGGTLRERYSGATCLGVVCKSPNEAIAMAAKRGIKGASTDNMGLSYIVYWRSLNTTPKEDTCPKI